MTAGRQGQMGSPPEHRQSGRLRRGLRMVVQMVRMHPKPFAIAVTGAAVFATCTVLSSVAVRWVTDHVIVPRFEEGEVATSTLVAGILFLGIVGFFRAAG